MGFVVPIEKFSVVRVTSSSAFTIGRGFPIAQFAPFAHAERLGAIFLFCVIFIDGDSNFFGITVSFLSVHSYST